MFKKIVIIGLGLMGGSLAAAARKKFPRAKIVGVARRQSTLNFASRKKWIHEGFLSITSAALSDADLVVLCAPVEVNLHLIFKLEKLASARLLVTDVGSVKTPICDLAKNQNLRKVCFVGAHPMVGSHEQGIEHADSQLYSQGLTVVTPAGKKQADRAIFKFWKNLSKNVVTLTPSEHDRSVAAVSHLPHLLAVCLMASTDDVAIKIIGAGFKDMTRLAAGSSTVWDSIFRQNAPALMKALIPFEQQLYHWKRILKSPKPSQVIPILDKQSSRRKKL